MKALEKSYLPLQLTTLKGFRARLGLKYLLFQGCMTSGKSLYENIPQFYRWKTQVKLFSGLTTIYKVFSTSAWHTQKFNKG